jgi:hypothetical protein
MAGLLDAALAQAPHKSEGSSADSARALRQGGAAAHAAPHAGDAVHVSLSAEDAALVREVLRAAAAQ